MNEKIRIVLTEENVLYEIVEFSPKKKKDGSFTKATQSLLIEAIDWCLNGDKYKAEIVSVE
jgi:hypothetical protein